MVSIEHVMRWVKPDLANLLKAESIFAICQSVGHTWRKTVLEPSVIIHLFVMQVLRGNTACSDLRHRSGLSVSASAYGQARMRLPLRVFQLLVQKICEHLSGTCDHQSLWHGHRLWHVDGSSASMPDTPELQQYFGQPGSQKPGCGFPVTSILALMHAGTGLLTDLLVRPLRTHEMSGIVSLHERLKANDVLIADRGFCSYAHICLLLEASMHCVFRIHARILVDFRSNRKQLPHSQHKGQPRSRYIRRLGRNDQLVEDLKPITRPRWMGRDQHVG